MQKSPVPKLQPLANTDCEEQIPEQMPRGKRRREDPVLEHSLCVRPQNQLDTRQNGKETQAQDCGLMGWEDSWKRFTGKGSPFTLTFWNFLETLQTGQQVGKAEEEKLTLSAQDDKNTPAAMRREPGYAGSQHTESCGDTQDARPHSFKFLFSMFQTQLSLWLPHYA